MVVLFREIVHGSAEFGVECALRDELLRRPLGMDLFEEDLESEREQWHFGLFAEEALVACGVVVPLGEGVAKVRQVAVGEAWQGKGLGRRLMAGIEEELVRRGILEVELHARREVVDFYLSLDYAVVGEEFEEVGLPHLKMGKSL